MRLFPIDETIREIWKIYPLRLSGLSHSRCCGQPTVLVQSKEGGFVTRNCSECGQFDTLPEAVFKRLSLWVACPLCQAPMKSGLLFSNYGYQCKNCDIGVRLADLLPRWSDILRLRYEADCGKTPRSSIRSS